MITLISEFHCIFHFERNGTRIISDGIWFEIKCKNGMKIQKKISLLHSCLFLLFIKIVLFFFLNYIITNGFMRITLLKVDLYIARKFV